MVDRSPLSNNQPRRLTDLIPALEAEAEANHAAYLAGRSRHPTTGFSAIDDAVGGGLHPGLHMLNGGPGAGKTQFAVQSGLQAPCPVLFVSFELGATDLARRAIACDRGHDFGALTTGHTPPEEMVALARAVAAAHPDLWIAEPRTPDADGRYLADLARRVPGDANSFLVLIDSLHAWAGLAYSDVPEYEALNRALTALTGIAAALNCPILVTVERNRASIESGGLSAGAGTRRIEYVSETVMCLDRDDKSRRVAIGDEVDVTLRIEKNRHGPAGRAVALRFNGRYQRFRAC